MKSITIEQFENLNLTSGPELHSIDSNIDQDGELEYGWIEAKYGCEHGSVILVSAFEYRDGDLEIMSTPESGCGNSIKVEGFQVVDEDGDSVDPDIACLDYSDSELEDFCTSEALKAIGVKIMTEKEFEEFIFNGWTTSQEWEEENESNGRRQGWACKTSKKDGVTVKFTECYSHDHGENYVRTFVDNDNAPTSITGVAVLDGYGSVLSTHAICSLMDINGSEQLDIDYSDVVALGNKEE